MSARGWCFTLNNYVESDLEIISNASFDYVIIGKEVGEQGTPHLQGYIYHAAKKSLKQLSKLLPRAHFEISKGTAQQNIVYCSKANNFSEFGVRPASQQEKGVKGAEKIASMWALARTGAFQQLPPQNIKTWEYIHAKYANPPEDRPILKNLWIKGPSGCGKSSWIRSQEIPFYNKPMSKWWDGYDKENMVVLDDFDPTHGKYLGYFLKIWADHYAFNAEVKGGMIKIRPGIVCITSQYGPEECFEEEKTVEAICRRFQVVDMSLEMSKHLKIVNMFE